jgi:4-amino-4-deoxy-L-arabinose transferase-like glycosyltransferase
MNGARFESRPRPLRANQWLLILFAVALALRVAAVLIASDLHQPYYEYMEIAQNLLDGKGYSWSDQGVYPLQPTSFLPPLYVYWCALFMGLFPGNYLILYLAQALVAATGVFPAFLVGRRLFSERVGWVFAAVFAVYPEMAFMSSRPVTEFAYVVLALWIVHFYLRIKDSDSSTEFKRALGTGTLLGISVLIKEGTVVLAAAVSLALLWYSRDRWRAIRRRILPMLAVMLLIMLPWMIRNYVVQGKFIPMRTGYGITLWVANHPGAYGSTWNPDGTKVISNLPPAYRAYIDAHCPGGEEERDAFYRNEALQFITKNPGHYLKLCLRRLGFFVWLDATHPLAQNPIYRISYGLLLCVALPGIVLAWRRRTMDLIIPLTYLGYLALYVPVLVLPRYRIIPVLLLLLMASYAIAALLEFRRQRAA